MRGFEPGNKLALIISECQRGVIDKSLTAFKGLAEQVEERAVVENTARLAAAFRQAGQLVVHAHVAHEPDYADLPMTNVLVAMTAKAGGMKRGSVDVEPVAGLVPEAGDLVHARTYSLVAFNGTDLDSLLRHRGITTVVLAGVSSNVAIPGMAVCASDLGYQVVIPEDCIAGASAETHAFSVQHTLPLFSQLTHSEDMMKALADMTAT